jgi:choline dehydrogenase-like flavoprotein
VSGTILRGRDLTADQTIEADVCIIGSGAGGAVLAAGLAEAGHSVVILEAGSWLTRRDFTLNDADAFAKLYQDRGGRATSDRAITVLQGKSVGGSTTVNWTTCFRTPQRILRHWSEHHGIPLTAEQLTPHWEAVEARLNIHRWDPAAANSNNRKLLDGCAALSLEAAPLRRNVRGCANSGYCGMGCPVNGKQSMHLTYLPDAIHAGARLFANTQAETLAVDGRRVSEVRCSVRDETTGRDTGVRLTVRPRITVCSGGAINSPALLLRSGLNHSGRVGLRTFLHPVIGVPSIYAEPVSPFYGAPQSIGSHHYIDRGPDRFGFFIEAAPLHPALAATAQPTFGAAAMRYMSRLAHTGILIALHVDGLLVGDEGGTVRLKRDGQLALDYPISAALVEGFVASHEALARISLAAGAQEVGTLHSPPLVMRTQADLELLKTRPYGALEHSIFSAHQMGGCAMGPDPASSVVGLDFRYHGLDDLFVVDGSVLPTALGVNPSQTIYGLAHYARDLVAGAL